MIFFPVVYLEDYYHPIYFQKKNMTTFFKTESFSKNNEKKERKKEKDNFSARIFCQC